VEAAPKKKWWRWGFNRWLVLLFIIASAVTVYGLGISPVRPRVQLPAEHVPAIPVILIVLAALALLLTVLVRRWEGLLAAGWFGVMALLPLVLKFQWTNTLTALVIADGLLLLISFAVLTALKSETLTPKGIPGAVEALLEYLYNITEGTAGKWARAVFPWFVTITLLVLIANWMELIPGVDSIGVLENAASGSGYPIRSLTSGIATIVNATKGAALQETYNIVPFVRVVSTDLNFTVALALIAVVMVQVMGVRAQHGAYFTKFWSTKTLFSKPIFGVIDFGVGLLELVSEFSKILSFAFRLFGNIFAGSVLLFVIGALVPVFAQSGFLMLEFFIGAIQAIVFGLLTMTFMAQAMQGHSGGEQEEA
jgi:F-type H+-transporting ATPase subunit a